VSERIDGLTAGDVIGMLGLVALEPEGGHVRQTWRDDRSSAIYYLVERPDFSGLHRLEHLEVWAWHAGAPVWMLLIHESGEVSEPVLGPDLAAGQRPQVVVPPRTWQAGEPLGGWSLVSTFMAPPYSDEIVTFARADDLAGRCPGHEDRIRRLCRFWL
jgi:predicted cupin superfamily sugar epimerase